MTSSSSREPVVVRAGRWLTKRRGVLLAPLFAAALLGARAAALPWLELLQMGLGLACLAGGTRLRLVAASYHESSHRSQPITAGPYAWVRHPLYLANFLLGLGIVLAAGWWPMVAAYTLIFLPLHIVIARSEEVHLVGLYGESYETYRRAVPAIVPWRRFSGSRYGAPSPFKIKKGKERLKAVGYLAGMLMVQLFKQWRRGMGSLGIPPLSVGQGILVAGVAGLAVVIRPKLRSEFLRASQTVLAVACVLALVIHLPGLWVPAGEVPGAPVPAALKPQTTAVSVVFPRPATPSAAAPAQGFLLSLAREFRLQPELLGGVGVFGVAALSEGAFQAGNGAREHELEEAGRAALVSVIVLSLFRQWHQAKAGLPLFSWEPQWNVSVRPGLDGEGNLTVSTIFKRRF